MDVELRNLHIDSGYLDLRNCRGLTCNGVRVTHPTGEGFRANNVLNSRLDGISIAEPGFPTTSTTAPSK
jgi:hypothetical protein